MSHDKLRQYILTHREDTNAFHVYIDRSKSAGRMITIDPKEIFGTEDLPPDSSAHDLSRTDCNVPVQPVLERFSSATGFTATFGQNSHPNFIGSIKSISGV